jgi:hypothetical protein
MPDQAKRSLPYPVMAVIFVLAFLALVMLISPAGRERLFGC